MSRFTENKWNTVLKKQKTKFSPSLNIGGKYSIKLLNKPIDHTTKNSLNQMIKRLLMLLLYCPLSTTVINVSLLACYVEMPLNLVLNLVHHVYIFSIRGHKMGIYHHLIALKGMCHQKDTYCLNCGFYYRIIAYLLQIIPLNGCISKL